MARGGLDVRPIFRHPLFLVSLIIAGAGWFTAFIGQAVLEAKYHAISTNHGSAVGVPWFGIFLQLAINTGVFIALGTDSVATHRFQLSVFLAIGVVFAVLGVNTGIFTDTSFQLAIGAGWLSLAVVDILWLLYFSSEEDAFFIHLFNSGSSHSFSRGSTSRRANTQIRHSSSLGMQNSSAYQAGNNYAGVGKMGQNGQAGMSVGELHHGHAHGENRSDGGSPQLGNGSLMDGASGNQEYLLKAKALYSYSASPDDPNEISFTKGEMLDIVDNSGKWWQARKSDGTKGIIPSNYVVLA